MLRHITKLFAFIFILFLVVGNLTAPAKLTQDTVQPHGVMGAFYKIGKFMIVPFESLKYRLDKSRASSSEFSPESFDIQPQIPPGYVESYFEFQGEKYKFYKPLHPEKSPYRENHTLVGKYDKDYMWPDFDAKDLVNDMYSKPVLDVVKFALDGIYGKYDEEDREIFVKYSKMQNNFNNWKYLDKVNPVGAFRWIVPPKAYGLPYTPEVLRNYFMHATFQFEYLSLDADPALPSKVMTGKARIDCDGGVLYRYALLYHLNKLMGIKAEYYEVDFFGVINGKENPVGHAELFVYYPETGKWEIYSSGAITEYFYRYRGRDINITAYKRYHETKEAIVSYAYNKDIRDSDLAMSLIFAYGGDKLKPPEVYVPVGKLQFNSFEEALYWYLYSDIYHAGAVIVSFLAGKFGTGIPGLEPPKSNEELYEEYKDFPIIVYVEKLPTPEDPYVRYLKEWDGKTVTVEGLKEDLIKKGQFREIKYVFDRGEPPEILKNPKPWFTWETAPPNIKERIEHYEKYHNKGDGKNENGLREVVDFLVKGLRDVVHGLISGTRLGG